ncbi:PIR Superfamily Protein [Plasmodium ovale wallikeri]|uniref:PIR protein n=2 Tax=Plasmodium ovale TaxID=36330 RepID=A0A1C3KIT4_PLAOA|nr:PIR Superfamily Protein [Plasmodium ovale wallikeri]SBT73766.1 PIR protein [Plasmodium ovale]
MISDNFLFAEAPSYKFNKELDSVIEHCSFCSFCDENKHSYLHEYGLKTLCYYFARNLETVHNRYSDKNSLKDKLCNDLIFWLQNNLINIHRKTKPDLDKILENFKDVWKDITENGNIIPKDNLCRTSFDNLLSFQECTQAKNVSNYCENYEYIRKELEKSMVTCGGYYEYLTKNSKTYDIISKGCIVKEKNYCLNYKECNTYSPQKLLNNPKCIIAKKSEEDRRKSLEAEEQYTQCGPEYECVPKNYFDTSINYSDYRIVPLIVLSIWGTFLSLYFLYKLSPFKSLLNNLLYKKKIARKNIHNEEFQELLESDSEDAQINFNNREYHITYNRE